VAAKKTKKKAKPPASKSKTRATVRAERATDTRRQARRPTKKRMGIKKADEPMPPAVLPIPTASFTF
jgi:hypothetical protein